MEVRRVVERALVEQAVVYEVLPHLLHVFIAPCQGIGYGLALGSLGLEVCEVLLHLCAGPLPERQGFSIREVLHVQEPTLDVLLHVFKDHVEREHVIFLRGEIPENVLDDAGPWSLSSSAPPRRAAGC